VTNVVVEQFQAPDTRRCAKMLELAHSRAMEQLAGRLTWVIGAGQGDPVRPASLRFDEAHDALTMQRIPFPTGESLAILIVLHVRAGDILVIRDSAAIGVSRMARECGAHVIWDRRVTPRRSGSTVDMPPPRSHAPALDAWLTAWTTGGRRAPRRLAAFIGAPDMLSAKEMGAGAADDSYEQLGWTSLLADVVREDRAERVGGTVAARPSVARR
jgi:hypothetical protein